MSNKVREQRVNELLSSLGDSSLRKAHNSLKISFKQMMAYVDAVCKAKDLPDEIVILLNTYQDLAIRFYAQFEYTLLQDILEKRDAPKQLNKVIRILSQNSKDKATDSESIKSLRDAKKILSQEKVTISDEYERLRRRYPTLLQQALDKLRDEWQRLNTIATASRVLKNDEQLMKAINRVVDAAAHTVGIDAEYIHVIPGNSFALFFFSYLQDYAILTVPIYSVRAPWEWSIFWHEAAGYRVRQLESNTAINDIQNKLEAFHGYYKKLSINGREILIDEVVLHYADQKNVKDYRFIREYLQSVFQRDRLSLDDLGDFNRQFELMMGNISDTNKFRAFERERQMGWNVNWYKELFEDAWSVIAIREPFIDFFENILSRHAILDGRHPPIDVRLKVAKQILNLLNPPDGNVEQVKPVEKSAAEQILKFISLLMVAFYKIPSADPDDTLKNLIHVKRSQSAGSTGWQIGQSIISWRTRFVRSKNPVGDAQTEVDKFIKSLPDMGLDSLLNDLKRSNRLKKKNTVTALLRGKNYRELLALPFFDVDYHTPGDIQLIENGVTYWVKPVDWNSEIWLSQRRQLGIGKTLTTEVVVREVSTGVDWKVKKADWDGWFKTTL